jgi:beta-xylosidase
MNVNGLRKPSYLAYRCLAILGNRAQEIDIAGLDNDLNGWESVREKGIDVVLFYFKEWTMQEQLPARTIELSLPGMNRADIYRIDETCNNIIAEWNAMGAPPNPTPSQIRELHARNEFSVSEKLPVNDGRLSVTLAPGTVALIRATK